MASVVVNSLLSIFGTPIRCSVGRRPAPDPRGRERKTKSEQSRGVRRGGRGREKNVSLNHLRPSHPRQTPTTRIVDDRCTLPSALPEADDDRRFTTLRSRRKQTSIIRKHCYRRFTIVVLPSKWVRKNVNPSK